MHLLILGVAVGVATLVADFAEFAFTGGQCAKHWPLEVRSGMGFRQVLKALQIRGHFGREGYWLLLARVRGDDQRIQAGLYSLSGLDSPWRTLDRLARGDTLSFTLTIPEGWTALQMLKAVQAHPHIRSTLPQDRPQEWMTAIGQPPQHPEGWFFPDTYRFRAGVTDAQILRRSFERMQGLLEREWAARAPDLPLTTPYEALILASIVEKETGQPQERPRIAAVFLERLNRGMRLETDPTVIYGLGLGYDGDIRSADLRTPTPYNTYLKAGLPPTPIALPGVEALRAVLHPERDGSLYFVARGDGSHEFTRSFEEHRAAVVRYQLQGDARRYPQAAPTASQAVQEPPPP